MRLTYIGVGFLLTFKELLRSRITLILLFLIPTLFYLIVNHTTGDHILAFKLDAISDDAFFNEGARKVSLVFIGIATVGLLTSFLALNLVQKNVEAHQRLVLCGYHPAELILSKLLVLLCFVIAIATYVAALAAFIFQPENWLLMTLGYVLGGYVYGCYGLLIGTLFKRELEGILFIVLLANIDAGWLQNPVYYTAAQNIELIHRLPAYFPSQISLTAAFTDYTIMRPVLGSIAYGSLMLVIAVVVYRWKMRIR